MDNNQQIGASLIDQFEASFTDCIHSFTKQESAIDVDRDEIKLEVEQTTLKFIDLARQMETFFLQKRFFLSSSKPELLLKEENVDLRHEITRKDDLIKKHLLKIGKWKDYLADINTAAPRPAMPPGAMDQAPIRHPGQPQMMPQMQANNPQVTPMANFMARPGFPGPQGPPMQNMAGNNPLAFLEKTTNNIDMGGPSQR